MSVTSNNTKGGMPVTFRRFKDGSDQYRSWQEKIFDADHSHKCPEYVLSTPPCQGSCPAGEDIRGYLNIVRGIEKPPAGMPWQEYAFGRLTEANPFPAVMGRVCPAPCESGCNRNQLEDFVGINSVEHFIGEWAIENRLAFKKPKASTGKKVAIIGGGPAGLACAYQLVLRGHGCTIFDEHAELGGMMRYGIPGFRTPRDVLDAEIQRILDLGVEVKLNTRVGRDVSIGQLKESYDAIFMALGAQGGKALPIPGAGAPNCVTAVAFLRAFNDGRLQHVGKRVVVVGGGDTSIDVATVARRLGHITAVHEADRAEHVIEGRAAHDVAQISVKEGAEVILVTRSAIDKMHANKHEIEHALAEGIDIRGGLSPLAVVVGPDGRATALRVGVVEKIGNATTVKPGTEQDIPADLIVSAIGQSVDFSGLEQFDNGKGLMSADKNYQVPGQEGVFVGGDVLRPHLLTTAVGHGSIAAEGIDRFLRGEGLDKRPRIDVHVFDLQRKMIEKGLPIGKYKNPMRGTSTSDVAVHNFEDRSYKYIIPASQLFLGHFPFAPRHKRRMEMLDGDQVLGHFRERLEALSEQEVVAEAKRCMSCGLCFECDNCMIYCPQTAVFKVKRDKSTTGRYVDTDYARCIGCHICADVCPTGYIQMGMGD